jgi:hypothetical protein
MALQQMSERTALVAGIITAAWITLAYVLTITEFWGLQ